MGMWSSWRPFQYPEQDRNRRRGARRRDRAVRPAARRELLLEHFEQRLMLTGPQLISIIPDDGGLLLPGDTLNIAPSELTFNFDQNQTINSATLAGIELVRSGGDGVFGNSNDVQITPGFIGIGTQPNTVVMRFSTPLPDDLYQVTIVGSGPNALTNASNEPFNKGVNQSQQFRLNLGPQVLAVVPQPISLPDPVTGVRSQAANEIDVYFNERLQEWAGHPGQLDPSLFQLIATKNTATTADDTVYVLDPSVPTSTPVVYADGTTHVAGQVFYNAANNEAKLVFGQTALVSGAINLNALGTGSFRLRFGNSDTPQQAPLAVPVPPSPDNPSTPNGTGPGDTFGTSMTTGTLADGQTKLFDSSIDPLSVNAGLLFPGGDSAPGAQNVPDPTSISGLAAWIASQGIQNHLIDGRYTSSGGVTTIPYNFQDIYGADVNGNLLHNQINSNATQMQRVRDIFSLFSYYSGVNFVETPHDGITVAVGDIRAVAPSVPATSANGIEGPTKTAPVVAIINGNVNWGASEYGGAFFAVAMHEIGHALGLGNSYDLPAPNAMGYTGVPGGGEDPNQPTQPSNQTGTVEPTLPGAGDIAALQYLYRTDSKDVDLYKFTLTQEGALNAETLAQRLTPTSGLNTVLTLYNELTLLGLPSNGGLGVSDGQTFSITSTNPGGSGSTTQTFEFNSGLSLALPAGGVVDGRTFSLSDGTHTVRFEFAVNGRQLSPGDTNSPINYNSNDSLATIAGDVVQAINSAVKNAALGVNGLGVQTINATYSGGGKINIGGDASTVFSPQNAGLTISGNVSVLPGHIMVRYAPANTQHDLAIAIANAITGASVSFGNPGGLNVTATAELNQVQLQGPISLDTSGAPALSSSIQRTVISRNDDYVGADSLINMNLTPGVYYIGVSSAGNTNYDPNITDSGWGGTTNGMYELRLNFQATPSTPTNPAKASLVSYVAPVDTGLNALGEDSPQPLDGDANGTPGGTYNFWFNVTNPSSTIFVDKTPPSPGNISGPLGSLTNPFTTIQAALNSGLLVPGTNLRIEGNEGASFMLPLSANPFAVGQQFTVSAGTVSKTFEFTNSAGVVNGQQLVDGNYAVVLPATYTPLGAAFAIQAAIQSVFPSASPQGDASGDVQVGLSSDAANEYVNLTGKLRITLGILPPPATPLSTQPHATGGTDLIVPRSAAPIVAGQTFKVGAGAINATFEFTNSASAVNGQLLPDGNYAVVLPGAYSAQNVAAALKAAISASPLAGAAAGNVAVTLTNDLTNVYATLTGSLSISVIVQSTPATPMSFKYSDVAYQIGTNNAANQFQALADGATFNVPRGVTVMIDPGAEFKMSKSIIDVGSSAQNIDRSQGALQVLGIPGNQVLFTSFADDTIGGQTEFPDTAPTRGDWGGLVFRNDSGLEPLGIFLNYVNEAKIRYGGGQVSVNGVATVFDAVDMESARPTVTNNIIIDSAQAPISATPNSFEDTRFQQNVRLTAVAGGAIVDGQTFQLHGATFEFINVNNPQNSAGNGKFKSLPGVVQILYHSGFAGSTDSDVQVALEIAEAINGSQLAHPNVQAAVTGNQVTITNVTSVDSPVALNVPFTGVQSGLNGQTFAIKGTVFQFFSGDAFQVPANGGAGIVDGATFTITQGANVVTFEFAANGRTLNNGHVAINYNNNPSAVVPLVDTMDTLAREIAQTINGALGLFGAGSPVSAAYSGKGVISIGSNASTSFNMGGSGLTLLAGANRSALTPNNVLVHFNPADSSLTLAQEIAAAINAAQIDGGTGQLVYAEAVQQGATARVDLMNSSDVNLSSPGSAPLTMSLLTPLSIKTVAGSQLSDGDTFTLNGKTFEFDSGYTLTVPQNLTLAAPNSFSISDGVNTVFFDFNGPSPARQGHVNIAYSPAETRDQLAQAIATAINNSGLTGVHATWLGSLGGQYIGQVNIGGVAASTVPGAPAATQVDTNVVYNNSALSLSGSPGYNNGVSGYALTVPDLTAANGLRSFLISDGTKSITFDFNGAPQPGHVNISFTPGTDTADTVAQAMVTAINAQGFFGVYATWLGQFGSAFTGQVNIEGVIKGTANSVQYPATLVTANVGGPPTPSIPALTLSGQPGFTGLVTGYVLSLPNTLSPSGVDSFEISDGVKDVTFDFNGPAQPGHVVISYTSGETPDQLAQAIAAAVNAQNFFGVHATWLGQFGTLYAGRISIQGVKAGSVNGNPYAATQVIADIPPLVGQPLGLSGTPGASTAGAIPVPFVPTDSAVTIATKLGTAVSSSNLNVSANSNVVGAGTVTFQNVDSLVPSPLLNQPNLEPIQYQLQNVFSFGADVLPLAIANDIYTADYERLGPDVHGNLLALPQPKVLTITAPSQVKDGQQFVINNLGFEFDNNNTTTAGFHSVLFTGAQLTAANAADLLAQAVVAAINAASNPASPQYVQGFNVTATIGQPGSGQVILSSNAANAAIITTAAPLSITQSVLENTINGLFVHIRTNLGQSIDTLDVSARFHDTDIPYVITSNLEITGETGGPLGTTGRESARLQVDPGVVVKMLGSRIEVGMGANFVAEADQNHRVIFTSIFDDTFGSGGTFFTNGDDQNPTPPRAAAAGDWGGIYFSPTSKGSIDHALITYAGGSIPIEGGFDSFNAVEIHQAQVRITNTSLMNNADGKSAGTRNGRGANDSAVIYVVDAQPVIVNDILQNNLGSAISINANALNDQLTPDWGRGTGVIDAFSQFADNYGPLVRLNKLGNNSLNGMLVRGGTLNTASIWDDTDIVHVVKDQITATNFATNGGLRLQSSSTQSLVIKFGSGASGFTATGTASDITDRIGGTVQVLGTAGHPVVMTALADDTVGAGLTPGDKPNNDTDNSGGAVTQATGSGPVFIDGGDRDKHGFTDASGVNQGGWQLIQQAMNYVYSGSRNKSATGILVIGATGFAQQAPIAAALALGLPAPTFITGSAISTVDFTQYRMIYVPSTSPQIPGGISQADLDLLTARKSDIQSYVNNTAGGLMALTEIDSATPFSWLAIPSVLTTKGYGAGGNPDPLVQTAALVAAGFNITNSQINFGTPWHEAFTGPAGYDNMQPFIVDSVTGEVEALGLAPGSSGLGGTVGNWQGIKFDEYANDRNVAAVNAAESSFTGGQGTDNTPATAQSLGALAPNQQSGDDKQRLGYDVHGFISPDDTRDMDVYSFSAAPGTQVWLDLSNTSMALDAVLELVDANGNVLARSDNSVLEQEDAIKAGNPLVPGPLLSGLIPGGTNLAQPMQSTTFQSNVYPASNVRDFGTINPRDPGMRVILPGNPLQQGQSNPTYYVRVYSRGSDANPYVNSPAPGQPVPSSSNGITSGSYDLQVRLQETREVAGSVVRFASINYAQNGITVLGQPAHSPLAGQSVSTGANNVTVTVPPSPFGSTSPTYFPGQASGPANAQNLGNLLTTDTSSLSVGGNLASAGQVDWYSFSLNYDLMQAIQHVNGADKTFATIFDIGYADGLTRPDTTISVFDQYGHLILSGRDSNISDQQPNPDSGTNTTNLSHGSFGTLDPYIGSAQLPVGYVNGSIPTSIAGQNPVGLNNYTYYVAISSNATLPTAMDATFNANSSNPLVRLEPLEGFKRVVEDHIGFTGYTSGNALFNSGNLNSGNTIQPENGALLPIQTVADLQQHVVPYTLDNVVAYVGTSDHLYTANPATGLQETNVAALPTGAGFFNDISIRSDGKMYGYQSAIKDTSGNSGYLYSLDPGTGAATLLGPDGAASKWGLSKQVDAMVWLRTGDNGSYNLYYSIRAGNNLSALVRANPDNGDTTAAPYGPVGYMDTGVPGGLKINSLPGTNIAEGQSFKITDLAGRTITFVFHNTANPPLPPPPAGAAYINFATGDTDDAVGSNMAFVISNAFANLGAPVNPPPNYKPISANYTFAGTIAPIRPGQISINNVGSEDFTNAAQFTVVNSGAGGFITGLSFDPATGRLFAVSSNGGVYVMNGPNPRTMQYLPASKVFSDAGYSFSSLSLGPQDLDWNGDGTPGDLRGVMLATADVAGSGGVLTAFSMNDLAAGNIFKPQAVQAGAPVAIFDNPGVDQNNLFGPTGSYIDHTSLGVAGGTGFALSPLDFNLWHPTSVRWSDAGHGINNTYDNSRVGGFSQSVASGDSSFTTAETNGGVSFYFGMDTYVAGVPPYFGYNGINSQYGVLDTNTQKDLTYQTNPANGPVIRQTYNLPGGADGILQTNTFSLAGYSSADKPTLYFNYYLDTRNNNTQGVSPGQNNFRDAARVYGSADGGKTWQLLATNDATQTVYNPNTNITGQLGELPQFATASADVPATTLNGQPVVDPRQQTQQLFNSTGTWRQARIDLGNFAGSQNIMLRFDFHTSGSSSVLSSYNPQFVQGDQYGNPAKSDRAQNLQHEGFYVDDIIVGLAERGEQVTNSPVGQTQFFTTPQNPTFGAPTETLTGPYQLQIRPGQATGQTINPNNSAIILNPNQFDVNDRLSSGYTLIAPEGHFNQSITQTLPAFNVATQSYTVPSQTFTFNNLPAPTGGGTLTISGVGDLEGILEYLKLEGIGDVSVTQNVFFNQSQTDKALQDQFITSTQIHLSQAQLQQLLAAGGGNSIAFKLTPQAPVDGANTGNLDGNNTNPAVNVNSLLQLNVTLDYASAPYDGQTFTISDGVNQAVFELDSNNSLTNPSDIRVAFDPTFTAAQLAQAMAAAINQQTQLKVKASTADARNNNPAPNTNDTSDRVNLFGAAWVQVGMPQVTVSGPESATSAPNTIASAYPTTLDSAAANGNRAFNGYGVLGNAAGTSSISNPRDVNLFQVRLNQGDAVTVQLNAGSILSSLRPYLRIFDAAGNEVGNANTLTQLPTLPTGSGYPANAFVSPDPYYTFTAPSPGFYYIGVSGAGNLLYDPTKPPPAWTATTPNPAGSTGYYQIHISVGSINVRGVVPPATTPFSPFSFFFPSNFDPGQPVNQGTLSYQGQLQLPVNPGDPNLGDDGTIRVLKYDYTGDTQVVAPQGSLILESNQINNSVNAGILISSSPREGMVGQANSSLPHQGGVVNTPVLNTARLVPGVVVENNLITNFGNTGIQFSGDADPAGAPLAAVPFGRLINNTIYGGLQSSGQVGIQVSNNASPTIINNIVANTQLGISIDASSLALPSPPVLGANLFQGNVKNTNLGNPAQFPNGDPGSNGIVLTSSQPLFTNPGLGNYYLKEFSPAIDSSLDSLVDRPQMTAVTGPLGISPSPILAPSTDINGQQRVDDPFVASPPGLGSNVFKDRGAVERADLSGPLAGLLDPADNDIHDQDPAVNVVHPVGDLLSEFQIQLNDGVGAGIDNSTVTSDRVSVRRNGVLLTPGVDYAFVYDNNNHIIRLIAASGVWQNGFVYDIAIDNGVHFDPQAANSSGTSLGIKDLAGNFLQANAPNGFTTFKLILDSVPNDPPAVTLPLTAQSVAENSPGSPYTPTAPSSLGFSVAGGNAVTVFDVDANGGVEQLTISTAQGTLAIGGSLPGINILNSSNGTNNLIFQGTVDALNAALNTLVYTPTPYFNGQATIQIVANDLGNSPSPAKQTTVFIPVTVTPVNNAPVVTMPATQTITEDNPLVFSNAGGNPISVFDVDVQGADLSNPSYLYTEEVRLDNLPAIANNNNLPQLVLGTTAGITFLAPPGGGAVTANGSTDIWFRGTLSAINTALDGLKFIPPAEDSTAEPGQYPSPFTLTLVTNDNGNIGAGAPQTATKSVSITVNPENDAPTIDNSQVMSLTPLTESLTAQTPAQVAAAISAAGGSNTVAAILATGANGAPITINTVTVGGQIGIAVTDATETDPTRGTWYYSTDAGVTWKSFGTAGSDFGVVSLSHALLLRATDLVEYVAAPNFNTNGTLAPAPTLTFAAWDQTTAVEPVQLQILPLGPGSAANLVQIGQGASTPFSTTSGTATLSISAVDSPPHITLPSGSFVTNELVPISFSGANAPVLSDPDINEGNLANVGQVSLTVSVNPAQGTLSLGPTVPGTVQITNGGNGQSSITIQGLLADINTAINGLKFTPAVFFASQATITLVVNDLGNFGALPSGYPSANGGLTDTKSLIVNVAPVHFAPVLNSNNGAPHFASVVQNTPPANNAGSSVGAMLLTGGTIVADVDPAGSFLAIDADAGAKQGIAVTGLTTNNGGTWYYSTNGGASYTQFTAISASNAVVLRSTDLIRFLPNQNFTGNVTLTFQAWDQTDQIAAGSRVNLTVAGATGGKTAYSAASATASLSVTPVPLAPAFHLISTTTLENNTVIASGGSPGGSNPNLISVPGFAFGISNGSGGAGPTTFTVTDYNNDPIPFGGLFLVPPAIDSNGTLTYQLNPDVFGVATLKVTASNGSATSAPQQTTITVTAIDDPPTLDPISSLTVLDNSGQNSVPLTGIAAGLNESQVMTISAISSDPSIIPNPTISYASPNATGLLFFTPIVGKAGTVTITVTVTDNGNVASGGVNTFKQTFNVTVQSTSPVATGGTVSMNEGSQTTIPLSGVNGVGNSGTLSATITSLPTGGTLYQTSDGFTRGAAITAVPTAVTNPNNQVIYVPSAGQFGSPYDSFGFTVGNGTQTSAPATETINVVQVNQAPTFTVGPNIHLATGTTTSQVVSGWAKNISPGAANESTQTLTFIVIGDTNPGLFSTLPAVDPITGNLTFRLAANASGSTTITLVLKDNGGTANGGQDTSAPQTFTISASAAPTANPETYIVNDSGVSSATAAAGVLANDADPNVGGVMTAVLVSAPTHGRVTLNADGSFSYTPGAGFQGLDRFSYRAADAGLSSSPTTVTIWSHEASIVNKFYQQVLNRAPDDSGLQYWATQLHNGAQPGAIAQGIFESNERLDPIISQYYQQFLLRPADAQGLAYWRDQVWKVYGGPEQVIAGMISSPEFFQSAGGTNTGWVTQLYQRLLNRTPDSQGLQYWVNLLNQNQATQKQVVLGFVSSDEYYTNLIDGFYQQYLQRAPSAAELSLYLSQFRSGASQRSVQISIVNQPEYLNNPPAPASGSVIRLFY